MKNAVPPFIVDRMRGMARDHQVVLMREESMSETAVKAEGAHRSDLMRTNRLVEIRRIIPDSRQ
jgi:hypothetical protein